MEVDARQVHKGRGAVSNRAGRFEVHQLEPFDDGWGTLEREPIQVPKTTVSDDASRTIINKNNSPDIPFDLSINPYKGCEHGCIYCYARQTHAFLGLSPGLDFETKIFRKREAPALLEQALRKKSYQPKVIMLGANTDCYQPVEREQRITRGILETLLEYRHPVALITKSALVLRDLDVLQELAKHKLTQVTVSVTTLDNHLANILEPRAAAPHRRLQVIGQLAAAGIPVNVNAAPMIPAINDMELEKILEAASERGAWSAAYILLRLPYEVKDLFVDWLQAHFPDRAEHVLSLLRQMRDGRENDPQFGRRMRGRGAYADLLSKRFHLACKRLGLNLRDDKLDTGQFRRPPRAGDQMSLF